MRENEKVELHFLDEDRISVFYFIHVGFTCSETKKEHDFERSKLVVTKREKPYQ